MLNFFFRMPRNYQRKTAGPRYTPEDLKRAVNDVLTKNYTYKDAEDIYGVPKSVIFHRIKGRKIAKDRMGAGRSPALPDRVENVLENCIKAKARMGYPCNKNDIKNLVGEYVQMNPNLKTPFKNGVPGDDWYYSFMNRHPSLSFKKPELLQKARKDARDPDVVYTFYEELHTLVVDNNLADKPQFVFNADESGFATDPKRLKAIGEKGKPLVRVSGGSGRESITVLAAVSADGFCMPPLIIFKGVGVQARWTSENSYPGTLYSTSKNGWMEEPQCFEWFSSGFVPHVLNLRAKLNLPDQAALLVYDGHSSHISYRIIKTALDHNIHLVKLPSHLTDQIQPLDKCVFGPVKTCWEKKLISFAKKQVERKDSGHLPKNKFVELLGAVWKESMKSQNIMKGFTSTGIFPVDAQKFPSTEFNPLALEKYKNKQKNILASAENIVRDLSTSNNNQEHQTDSHLNIQPSTSNHPSTSHHPSTSQQVEKPTFVTPSKIIEIFSNSILENRNTPTEAKVIGVKRQIVPRLKPIKYGEILTTAEVLQKQMEAEEAKKNKLEKKNNKTKKPKVKPRDSPRDELKTPEPETDVSLHDSSDENEEDFRNSVIAQNIKEVNYERPEWVNLKVGIFLLVDFLGGRRKAVHYKYVCCIQNMDEETGDIKVTGFRRHDKYSTEFKLQENDVSLISLEMIEAVLPEPRIEEKDRAILYIFPGSVGVFEK